MGGGKPVKLRFHNVHYILKYYGIFNYQYICSKYKKALLCKNISGGEGNIEKHEQVFVYNSKGKAYFQGRFIILIHSQPWKRSRTLLSLWLYAL